MAGLKKPRETGVISAVTWLTRGRSPRREGKSGSSLGGSLVYFRHFSELLCSELSNWRSTFQTVISHLTRAVMANTCQYINLETLCTKKFFDFPSKTRRSGNPGSHRHPLGAESTQVTMAPSSDTGLPSLHPMPRREADCQLVSHICSYSAMWTPLSHPQTRIQLNPRDEAQRSEDGCGRTRSELRDWILLLKSSSGRSLVSPSQSCMGAMCKPLSQGSPPLGHNLPGVQFCNTTSPHSLHTASTTLQLFVATS